MHKDGDAPAPGESAACGTLYALPRREQAMNEHRERVPDPWQERMTQNIEDHGPAGVPKGTESDNIQLDDLITRDIDLTEL